MANSQVTKVGKGQTWRISLTVWNARGKYREHEKETMETKAHGAQQLGKQTSKEVREQRKEVETRQTQEAKVTKESRKHKIQKLLNSKHA